MKHYEIKKIKSKFLLSYKSLIIIAIGLLYSTIYFILRENLNLRFHAFFAVAIILTFFYMEYLRNKSIFSSLNLIVIVFYLFQSGQTFLYLFNVENLTLFNKVNYTELLDAQIYFNFSLLFFIFGIVVANSKFTSFKERDQKEELFQLRALKFISILLLVFTLFPKIVIVIKSLEFSLNNGYYLLRSFISQLTASSMYYNVIFWLSNFFDLGLYIALVAFNDSKKPKTFLYLLVLFISLSEIIIGSRFEVVTRLLVIIMVISNFKVTKKNNTFFILISGVSLLFMVNFVRIFRQLDLKTLNNFVNSSFRNFGLIDGIKDLIMEMGGSMYPFIVVKNTIPKLRAFGCGTSYLFSVFSFLPSFLIPFFDYTNYTNLHEWLTNEILAQSSGAGFSMSAEAYYNFGWLGVLVFIIFGLITGFVFKKLERGQSSLSLKIFAVILFDAMLVYPRAQIVAFMRNFIFILITITFIKNVRISNKYNNFLAK